MVFLFIFLLVVLLIALYDLFQRKHAILRNFPIIGHFRYLLESVGPELRQYIVTSNDEERPFSRDQRRWVYASAKRENNYFGFGTDNDLDRSPNHLIFRHVDLPEPLPDPEAENEESIYGLPAGKVLGGARGRRHAFRPASVINISGMSFGSLSGPAVAALNEGSKLAGCLQNTGEGGISPYHLNGGDLIWQIGSGYFGCRDEVGRFSLERFLAAVEHHPVRAVEIKLSQGAKPGLGGVLPAAKITPEIAKIRGVPLGEDCVSPAHHTAFSNVDSLLDFVELLADRSGLPVGIKSAVGGEKFWHELAAAMQDGTRGVDFITIDGGEGGTGAAPLVFTDNVSLPFKIGFSRVYRIFQEAGLSDDVVFIGSGKLGFPDTAALAFVLGCDMINVGREAMLAIGCIQAQRCHTGRCPTGVATQNRWLQRGLDPASKAVRLSHYVITLRKELFWLARSCGEVHPAFLTGEHIEFLDGRLGARSFEEQFGYSPGVGLPSEADRLELRRIMAGNLAAAEFLEDLEAEVLERA
jgi:glutamate synthase (ferredoxin)